jgi:fructan beta-fructosidase
MNDPNGMVYFDGEYHLFYQYYPDSTVWGPMHWGHAVSTDLVHWEHLPIALYPDSLGYIFSGSAVIDWKNASGLGNSKIPPMIAIFTHHNPEGAVAGTNTFQYQSIAYSNDRGRSWSKYAENPVIENPGIRDFRDPKVIWSDKFNRWIMVFAAFDRIKIYTSENLTDWTFASDFGPDIGSHGRPLECPDFFPMTINETGEEKWIMIISVQSEAPNGGTGIEYFTGDFDGTTFTNDNAEGDILWLDYGKDNYAGVTWSDIPTEDGRRLLLGWMSNWQYANRVPTEIWRSAMTLPRAMTLHQTSEGLRLHSNPISELKKLRTGSAVLSIEDFSKGNNLFDHFEQFNGLYELEIEFVNIDSGFVEFELGGDGQEHLAFGYNADQDLYFVDRTFAGESSFSEHFAGLHQTTPLEYQPESRSLRVYLDHSSIEVFADGGRSVLTEIFFPNSTYDRLSVKSGQTEWFISGHIHQLSSIW